eukprot:3460829-Pyramimonas_sp.AAC.2
MGSSGSKLRAWLRQTLEARFKFGKYRDCHSGPVDFAGRRVTFLNDRAIVDQEKYILEEIRPLTLARGRLSDRRSLLENEEFRALRS